MPTFQQIEQQTVVKALSEGVFSQLYRSAAFPSAGVTSLSPNDGMNQYYEKGEAVSLRRVKDTGVAQDYDPRSGTDLINSEPGYVITQLVLERLFTQGFPTYSSDAQVERYVREFAVSNAGAIRRSLDDYLYNKGFRDWSLASTGTVSIAAHPPLAIVAKENASGVVQPFSKDQLINAGRVLDSREVPSTSRFARIGTTAKAGFLGDSILVEGFAGAQASMDPGRTLINTGITMQQEIERYGFMVRGSNAITGQNAVTNLGDGVAAENITAVADDTTVFFRGDNATSTPLGAVKFTLGITAAFPAGIAVGAIARIAPSGGAATAYGVIIRVSNATKDVWMVPYSTSGVRLVAAQFNTGTDLFTIPQISEVNVAGHKEHLIYASRLLTPPSPGSGAIASSAIDPETGLAIQVFKGSYNVFQFKEGISTSLLCGAAPTDWRKAVLIIS